MSKESIKKRSVEIKVYEEYDKDEQNNQEYRYVLIKEWDKADKIAAVIMYNPSDATCLMYDKTVMNVENYLKKKEFNKIIILNLFAIKGKDSSIVANRNENYERQNIKCIKKYVQEANEIYLAWGYGKTSKAKYVAEKIKEVETIVRNIKRNDLKSVRAFADEDQVNVKCHPQNMNIESWIDIEYDFDN